MNLKLRNLEMFRLFAQTENVTETARLMRISQPAVSQILKDLETQVGIPLFRRAGRRLQLTTEARAFLPDVERLITQMAALQSRAASLRDGQSGTLFIASIPTLARSVLPRAIARFRAARPHVRLRVGSYTAMDVARQIRSENADLGITFLPINDLGVRTEPLLRTAVACLVPRGSPLSKEPLITPARLRNEYVIAQGAGTPPGFVLRDYFEKAGLADWPVLEVNQSEVALHLVEHHIGVALSHPLVLSVSSSGKVIAIPFEPEISLTLALVHPKHGQPSRFVGEFTTVLRECLSELSTSLADRGLVCRTL